MYVTGPDVMLAFPYCYASFYRFERYVTLYAFPIMMVFMWMIIIASATLRIVNDKQMALEEVSYWSCNFLVFIRMGYIVYQNA